MKKRLDSISTVAHAVRVVINAMSIGYEFHGWELKQKCVNYNSDLKNVMDATFLREMRDLCHFDYILINQRQSLYKKVGREIAGSNNY